MIQAFLPLDALAGLPLPDVLPLPLVPLVDEAEVEEDHVVVTLGGRGLNCNNVDRSWRMWVSSCKESFILH